MKKSIHLLLVLMFLSCYLFSQQWERISPKPIETNLFDITKVPGTNRIIAVGSGSSLLYSDDDGENWTTLFNPCGIDDNIVLKAISFPDSQVGYAVGTDNTILKSDDSGNSWNLITESGDSDINDVCFINTTTGFISIFNKILKTFNGGQTWDTTDFNQGITPKYIHFVNDTIGYFCNTFDTSYYKTNNCGNTWQRVDVQTGINNLILVAINFYDMDNGVLSGQYSSSSGSEFFLFRTTNGGLSWQQTYSDYYNYISDIDRIGKDTLMGVGKRVMYDNIILTSFDDGLTWEESNMTNTFYTLRDIKYDYKGMAYCVGDNGQILQSNDYGKNWININEGLNQYNLLSSFAISDSIVILGCETLGGGVSNGCIYRSSTSGLTWNMVYNPNREIHTINFYDENYGIACSGNSNEIFHSSNGGLSWITSEIVNYWFNVYYVYQLTPEIAFASGKGSANSEDGIYKTINNWDSSYKTNCRDIPVDDIVFADDSVGFAISLDYLDRILKTNDQGENWDFVTITETYYLFYNIEFINENTGIIASYPNILKTKNKGETWYEVSADIDGFFEVGDMYFSTENTGYISVIENEVKLLKTIDGGESWFPIDYPSTTAPNTVCFFSENEGLFMGNNGTIFKTYTSGLVDLTLFYDKKINESELLCYPVPAKDILSIKLLDDDIINTVEYNIFNISGKKILFDRRYISKNEFTIDVSELPKGIYVLRIISDNKNITTSKILIHK